MPKVDYDKLQDALEAIKTVCEDHIGEEGCSGCPLGNKNGICKLGICPKEWQPRNPVTDAFRVLE